MQAGDSAIKHRYLGDCPDEQNPDARDKKCAACRAMGPAGSPRKGELWDSLRWGGTCRVMCDPVEGYVMARYKGAVPWLMHVSDWHKNFKRHGEKPANDGGATRHDDA